MVHIKWRIERQWLEQLLFSVSKRSTSCHRHFCYTRIKNTTHFSTHSFVRNYSICTEKHETFVVIPDRQWWFSFILTLSIRANCGLISIKLNSIFQLSFHLIFQHLHCKYCHLQFSITFYLVFSSLNITRKKNPKTNFPSMKVMWNFGAPIRKRHNFGSEIFQRIFSLASLIISHFRKLEYAEIKWKDAEFRTKLTTDRPINFVIHGFMAGLKSGSFFVQ